MALAPAAWVATGCKNSQPVPEGPSGAESARYGAVTYQARTQVGASSRSGPLSLLTSIQFANNGSRVADIIVPAGCLVSLRVRHANESRQWDQVRWRALEAQKTGFVLACADTGARLQIAPGSRAIVQSLDAPTVADVLGDSLPEGDYLVTATVFAPTGSPTALSELSAGRVRLARR